MSQPADLPHFIEVEISAYCNRRCSWCPNHDHERGRSTEVLDPAIWLALLAELGALSYAGEFAFHNYNEPLFAPDCLARLTEARAALRQARLVLFSNGDPLIHDLTLLDTLAASELDELRITRYPKENEAGLPPQAEHLHAWLTRIGLPAAQIPVIDEGRRLVAETRHAGLRVRVIAPRIDHYSDRGGSLSEHPLLRRRPRREPCLLPMNSAAIDVHGRLKLCCQIYDTTTADGARWVGGDLAENGFLAAWHGARMARLRRLTASGQFETLEPCRFCSHKSELSASPQAAA